MNKVKVIEIVNKTAHNYNHSHQYHNGCNLTPFLTVPFFIEKYEYNKECQFRITAHGEGGKHGHCQYHIAGPQLPLPVPVHPIVIQIDSQQDKKLIHSRFPENAKISVPMAGRYYIGKPKIIKFLSQNGR